MMLTCQLNRENAHTLMEALRTNAPFTVHNDRLYQITREPSPETARVLLYILILQTTPERANNFKVNTVYLAQLLELRPELELLYHGDDPWDWLPKTEDEAPKTQAFLLAWSPEQTLPIFSDLCEAVAFWVMNSEDHQVLTVYLKPISDGTRSKNEPD